VSYVLNPFTGNFDTVITNWIKKSSSISASSSLVVDATPLTTFDAREYIISIKRLSDGKVRTFNLNVVKDGTDVKDSVFGKVGGTLNVAIDTEVNLSTYELKITNNNLGSGIEVKLLKTKK
jgi:hypothetical protein